MSGTVAAWIAIAIAVPVFAAAVLVQRSRTQARRARGPAELGDALRRARERSPEPQSLDGGHEEGRSNDGEGSNGGG